MDTQTCDKENKSVVFEKWNSPLTPLSFFITDKIKFIRIEESLSDYWERKIFFELTPLRFVPRCALLLSVVGAYNKGYTVRGSARPSPKFCSVLLRKTSYIPNVRRHISKSLFKNKERVKNFLNFNEGK